MKNNGIAQGYFIMNSALSSLQNSPLMGFAVCFNPGTVQEAGFADKQFFHFSTKSARWLILLISRSLNYANELQLSFLLLLPPLWAFPCQEKRGYSPVCKWVNSWVESPVSGQRFIQSCCQELAQPSACSSLGVFGWTKHTVLSALWKPSK